MEKLLTNLVRSLQIAALITTAGCYFEETESYADLTITTNQSLEDKVALANELAKSSVDAGLFRQVAMRFPQAGRVNRGRRRSQTPERATALCRGE